MTISRHVTNISIMTAICSALLLGITQSFFSAGAQALIAESTQIESGGSPSARDATIAITTTRNPSKDNAIYEGSTNSNGAGPSVVVGVPPKGNDTKHRALLAFDLTDIPTDTVILSATLQLHMSNTNAGTKPVELHRLKVDWGEAGSNAQDKPGRGAAAQLGDATWDYTFYTSTQWSQAGGDYVTTASATTDVADVGSYTWQSDQLLKDVQSWIANPATNFGWILIGDESTTNTGKRIDTRENSNPAARPQLILAYDVVVRTVYLPLIQR